MENGKVCFLFYSRSMNVYVHWSDPQNWAHGPYLHIILPPNQHYAIYEDPFHIIQNQL